MTSKKEIFITVLLSLVLLLNNITSATAESGGADVTAVSEENIWGILACVLGLIVAVAVTFWALDFQYKNNILMIQIGLSGEANDLQSILQSTVHTTNTSTSEGLNRILKETTMELLLRHDYWAYGYSRMYRNDDIEDMKKGFQKLSIREIINVEYEDLATSEEISEYEGLGQNFTVVTILLTVEECEVFPVGKDKRSMKAALQFLNRIQIKETEDLLVLWSPQDRMQTMTEEQLEKKFPRLKPIENLC